MNIPQYFSPKKILVIQLRQLGDVILTTPAIRPLKERFPEAVISFLTEKNAYDILSGNPYLDEIITIKRKATISEQLNTIMGIRKKRFDLVLDFMSNPRTTYISLFSGAKVTVAYDTSIRRLLYTVNVKPAGDYVVDHKLSMLRPFGIEGADNTPYMHVPQEAREQAASFLDSKGVEDNDFLVCIDATHRRATRRWAGKWFAEVADRLKEKYNAKVVFLWGPGEREEVEGIMSMCRHRHIIDTGTDIKGLAALLKRANLLVGNCSFPRHVAASQGTPTLVIHGATGEEWKHPAPIHRIVRKGLSCQPCNRNICSDLSCLTTLTADDVMNALQDFLPAIIRRRP